ncbi:protein RoBo-1-like isoform X2 [Sceloporus undulatus]|uniref:protein RoBo-1-like isoform X2 n=1 Tax=Sceloporus undulatus TaxID=8520 RepID=UPI001C4B34C3|nr:protein RoBo-1-like isoform X2 [Sceloporus undulatus]
MHDLLHTWLRSFLFFALITTDGVLSVSTIKGCESVDICSTPTFYLEMGNQSFYKASVVCCTGEECKTATPHIPPPPTATNGKICPACYTTTGKCGNKTVTCTGLQKFCFDVSTVITTDGKEQDYIVKGCTTQSVCAAILTNRSPVLGDAIVKKASCVPNPNRGSTTSPELFLSLFYGFLLLKILL